MVTSNDDTKLKRRFSWRSLTAGILVVLGLVSLVAFSLVHWTERQVLTTDNWVQVVGPLPKDDAVATALSTYSVNQLFTATDLEDKITEALPDRAAFLAPTLSDQLQSRLTNRTKQFIQSDTFQSAWETANRLASDRLITNARNPEAQSESRLAQFSMSLPVLRERITSFLNERSSEEVAEVEPPAERNVGLAVGLKASVEKVHTYIRTVDFLNATLGLLSVVCLVGAVVFSRARRKLLLGVSAAMVVISLLQIIGIKSLRPYIINQINEASYRPAIGVVYDTLLASFRNSAILLFLCSVAAFLLVLVCYKPFLTRSKAIADWFKEVQASRAWKHGVTIRQFIGTYRYHLMGGFVVLVLIMLAFVVQEFTPVIGIRAILFILLFVELISLLGLKARSRRSPMKQ